MISEYNVREEFLGDDVKTDFSFDFEIADLTELLIVITDSDGVETDRVRGDDTTIIDTVTWEEGEPGGIVAFIDPPEDGSHIFLMLAPDETLQESEFKNKGQFTLPLFEAAIDVLARGIQRLQYLAKRSINIGDEMLDSEVEAFNFRIGKPFAGAMFRVNDNNDGLEWVNPSDVVDRSEGEADLANNQVVAADVDGLLFDSLEHKSFELLMSVQLDATADKFETFKFLGCAGAAGWVMSSMAAVGDDSGVDFTITLAGQVQYTSGNAAGFASSVVKWKILSLRAA